MTKWAPYFQSIARIIFGFLLFRHGMEQVLGFPKAWVPAETLSYLGILKVAAGPAGILIMLGLFTRPVCLLISSMYLVYWFVGLLPATLMTGARLFGARGPSDPVLLNGFFFLYLTAAGPGPWSLDRLRNPDAAAKIYEWAPHSLAALRLVAGFLFIHHGIEKYFGGRIPIEIPSLRALAGGLELSGGPLLMLGLFTRPLMFLLSGEMAFAYFINHAPEGFWGSFIEPNQEAAILNCYLFLFMSTVGGGIPSIDHLLRLRRARARSALADVA
jgi:putative oxidoreductase